MFLYRSEFQNYPYPQKRDPMPQSVLEQLYIKGERNWVDVALRMTEGGRNLPCRKEALRINMRI